MARYRKNIVYGSKDINDLLNRPSADAKCSVCGGNVAVCPPFGKGGYSCMAPHPVDVPGFKCRYFIDMSGEKHE